MPVIVDKETNTIIGTFTIKDMIDSLKELFNKNKNKHG